MSLVKHLPYIDSIWEELFQSFGSTNLLLDNKLSNLDQMGDFWKVKSNEKVTLAVSSMINTMTELSNLAKEHKLELCLYQDSVIDKLDQRRKRFHSKTISSDFFNVEYPLIRLFLQ